MIKVPLWLYFACFSSPNWFLPSSLVTLIPDSHTQTLWKAEQVPRKKSGRAPVTLLWSPAPHLTGSMSLGRSSTWTLYSSQASKRSGKQIHESTNVHSHVHYLIPSRLFRWEVCGPETPQIKGQPYLAPTSWMTLNILSLTFQATGEGLLEVWGIIGMTKASSMVLNTQ